LIANDLYITVLVVYTSRMSDHEPAEKNIPLGVVLMAVGIIIGGTAVAAIFVWPKSQPTSPPQPVEPIYVVVTSVPSVDEAAIALLPETPLEEDLPDHFIYLDDAVKQTLDGQPGRIVIPAIDLDAPVHSIGLTPIESGGQVFYQWQVPGDFVAGWHNTSAPLGQPGNTVLNGHHNIYGEVFGHLIDLEPGDEIVLWDDDEMFQYTVSQIELFEERGQPLEVRKQNSHWIAATDDERVTLVTCWPHDDNSHRLVVVAHPIVAGNSQ
jgi:LPXTG-site transpeptidase (sortase) family protein